MHLLNYFQKNKGDRSFGRPEIAYYNHQNKLTFAVNFNGLRLRAALLLFSGDKLKGDNLLSSPLLSRTERKLSERFNKRYCPLS
jgi:hypothetical protein